MAFLKNIWKNNGKHKKLSEELALQIKDNETDNEIEISENPDNDVVTFKLKYLGSTVVEKVTGDSISVEAVKNIIKVAKASRKKLHRVNVAISLKGIVVTDLQGSEMFKISIYRISNCSTDASHRQVFSFISTDANETMECHAFLCSKRKLAETVTLAVAHAFSTAYEAWRILPSTKKFEQTALEAESLNNVINSNKNENETQKVAETKYTQLQPLIMPTPEKRCHPSNKFEEKLIDFDDEIRTDTMDIALDVSSISAQKFDGNSSPNQWVSFEDDFNAPKWPTNKMDLILA